MSTTVDERVVSLQFDNREFEKNVSTTMNTLEKFKQKLNFKGTANGLEEVSKAAGKVDMSGLSKGVEAVQMRFSAMQVAGVTAIANITNSAVNAGKRIVSALTIDPIKTGFQEYETQINSVQTILANTKSKGSTLDDVNAALDELNKYADQTIYNFTEMTRNIGTFTAAGVDLETSTNAIQGIANLAAVSGSSSQQASTAMYQLSQALAAGRVSLMDWNSVVNAGMGGQLFQDALKKTSEELGTGAEAAIAKYGSFRESLSRGKWLTTDVLTETLKKFTTTGANEYIAEFTGLTQEAVAAEVKAIDSAKDQAAAIDQVSESLAKKSGKSKDAIKESLEFAYTAQDAATKVKTFTQLWDVLKEAAQSGWTQTWELLIGDFEEAKNLLTPLADFLTGAINAMSEARNKVLGSALGKGFTELGERIRGCLEPINKTAGAISKVAESVQDYGNVVNEIIGGKWGNGQERWDKLTKAGYDWAHAQNLVNEKLGSSVRHTETTKKTTEATGKLTEAQAELIASLTEKNDEQLREMGYNDEQIDSIRELEKLSKKLNIPVKELSQNLDEINGRWILMESFKNIFQPFITIAKALGKAWKSAFDPITGDDIFNIIAAFHKFSTYLVINEKAAKDLTNVFKGLFAIIDIVASITGGALKIGFKIIGEVFKALGYGADDVLHLAGSVGEAIAKFRDWLEEHNLIYKIIEKIVPLIVKFAKKIGELIGKIAELPIVQSAVSNLVDIFTELGESAGDKINVLVENLEKLEDISFSDIKGALSSFKDTVIESCDDILNKFNFLPKDLASGFVKGIGESLHNIKDSMFTMGETILETIKEYLGIHSPSTKAIEIMGNFVDGLVIGARNGVQKIVDSAKTIVEPLVEVFKGIDIGKLFVASMSAGALVTTYKFAKGFEALTAPAEGIGTVLKNAGAVLESVAGVIKKSTKQIKKILNNVAGVVKSFSKMMKAKAFKTNTEGIMNIAKAMLVLAGALFLISMIDSDRLWESVGVLAVIATTIGILAFAMSKLGESSVSIGKDGIQMDGIKNSLITIGIVVVMIAFAVKLIGQMDPEEAKRGFWGLFGVVAAITAVFYAYGKMVDGEQGEHMDKAAKMIKKLAWTMILMVGVVKIINLIDADEVWPAVKFVAAFIVMAYAFGMVGKLGTENCDKVGKLVTRLVIALALMVGVIKLINKLKPEEMEKGVTFCTNFALFVLELVAVTYLAKDNDMKNLSKLIFSVTGSMLLMILVIKMIAKINDDDMKRGVNYIVGFGVIIVALVGLLSLVSKGEIAQIGMTLIGMAVAIAIIAGVAVLMSYVDIGSLAKGLIVVGILSMFVAGMAAATNGASDCKGSIMAMAVAIGVMAAAIVILSFIKPEKLVGPVAALGILMGMFGLMMKMGSNIQSAIGPLIVMVVAIGIMTAAIMILSKIPFEQAMGAATSLSLLMLAMSGCLFILSKIGGTTTQALLGVVSLLALCVPLLALVGILYLMQNVNNAMESVKALTLLMGAMTLLLIPLSLVGAFIGVAIAGVIGLLAMAVPMVAFVGILALMNKIENAQANGMLLILLMTTMTNCLVKLGLVAPLLLVAEVALVGLIAIIGLFGGLATAVGGLLTLCPEIEEMINKGIPLLISLAGGIGEMIGAFIGGAIEQITDILPNVGTSLSDFATNVQPFIDSMTNVDSKILDSVKILAGCMIALTAAELIENLTAWFTGGTSLSDFGLELALFGPYLARFGAAVSNVDPAKIKSAAEAAKLLAEMAAVIPNEGGVISLFTGDNSLDNFGNSMASFGGCLSTFYNNVKGIDPEAVKQAAKAGMEVVKLADSIPNEGGIVSLITGDNSLDKFGNSMAAFAGCLTTFYNNAVGIDVGAVKTACEAGQAVIDMAKTIPNEGGMAALITGDNTMDNFGNSMASLGECLITFSDCGGTISIENIQNGVDAAKSIIDMANTIPNEGGLVSLFTGDNNLADFSTNLPTFGDNLKLFSDSVTDVDMDAVKRSGDVIRQMAQTANNLPKDEAFKKDTLADFGKNLPSLGKNMAKFYKKMKDINIDDTNRAISCIENLANIGNHLVGYSGEGMKNFESSLKTMAKNGINDFTDTFKNSTEDVRLAINTMFVNVNTVIKGSKTDFENNGITLMLSLAKGISDNVMKVKQAIGKVLLSTVTTANSEDIKSKFTSAGKNMVNGFASGITAQTWKAEAKASAMARAALDAAKETLDINSPSKEARKLGFGIPEGLAQGIDRMSHIVDSSASNMASTALDSTSNILSKIARVVDSDVDYQPTIRPVVDLSNVETSSGLIGGMFSGLTPSVGLLADVNSINGSMNARLQNGMNDDVVSAIEKLGSALGSLGGGDTYNINGITYDDGSNIANAVSTLTRAARIERRI